MLQKLSSGPRVTTRSAGRPTWSRHNARASSSPSNTLVRRTPISQGRSPLRSTSQCVRGAQAVAGQAEVAREKRPGKVDGVSLAVAAKRKVAQHLKERMMTRRVPDIVQVVVLA
jgi:hypothetical protein